MLTIDLSQITEEEIKEATANLSKVVSNELNDAVKKGLNNSLDRYSQTFSRSVSTKLLSAIKTTVATDMAKEFTQYFHSKEFKDPIVKGLQSAVNSAFSNLAPVKMNVIPVIKPDTSATLHDLLQSGSTVTDRNSSPFMPVLSPDKAPTLADLSSSGSGTDILSSFDELSKSTAVILDNQGELNDVVKKAANDMLLLDKSLSSLSTSTSAVNAAEQRRLDTEHKKAVFDAVKPDTSSDKDGALSDKISKSGLNFGGSLQKMVLAFLTRTIKEAFVDYFPRNRQALVAAGSVLPSSQLADDPTKFMRATRDIKEKMEYSSILKQYGGENAFSNYMSLRSLTGGLSKEEMADPEKAKEGMEKMTASAVLAGMNLDMFAKKVEEGILVYGMNETASKEFISALADQAKFMHTPFADLQGYLNSANSSLRQWGHSLSESYGIATRFGKALEEGRISMGDIISFASGLHKTGEGESAFLTQALSNMSGPGSAIAKSIMSLSQGDPLKIKGLFRSASEGTAGISSELGLRTKDRKGNWTGPTDTDIQRQFRQGILKAVEQMASGMSGGDKYVRDELLRKLLPLAGINADMSQTNLRSLMGTYADQPGTSNWKPRKKVTKDGTKEKTSEEKILEGMKENLGPVDTVRMWATNAIVSIGNYIADDTNDFIKNMKKPISNVATLESALNKNDFKAAIASAEIMQANKKLVPGETSLSESLKILASDLKSDLTTGVVDDTYKKGLTTIVPIILKDSMSDERAKSIIADINSGIISDSTIKSINELAEISAPKKLRTSARTTKNAAIAAVGN